MCRLEGERVHLGGHAVRYAESRIFIDLEDAKP
jgi:hypothetical protein